MNIENLSQSEKYSLLSQLEKSLGLYPLMVLTIDDVKESISDSREEMPDDDKLHTMCKYVARIYNVADEYMVALNWATELCLETV
jgi:hypothetical protein